MQQIQYDEGGYINWTNADWVDGMSKKVQGLEPSAAGASATTASWTRGPRSSGERERSMRRRPRASARAREAFACARASSPGGSLGALARRCSSPRSLIFVGTQCSPATPRASCSAATRRRQAVHALDQRLHLDRPPSQQYATWLGGFVHGDLGDSSVGLAQGRRRTDLGPDPSPVKNSVILARSDRAPHDPAVAAARGARGRATRAGRSTTRSRSASLAAIALPEFVIGSLLVVVFFIVARPVAAGRADPARRRAR